MKHNPLLGQLRAAFPLVPIDATGAWEQRGKFYCDAREYGHQMHGKTWEQLDAQFFARRSDGLSFLGTPYLMAVLPLYLHLMVVFKPTSPVPETLLPKLTKPFADDRSMVAFDERTRRFDEIVQAVTEPQSRVVAATLEAFVVASPNEGPRAQPALDRYWSVFSSMR